MTQSKTAPRAATKPRRKPAQEPLPTWRNTRPRGNPETDRDDMKRSVERMEAVLGR